MIDRNDIIGEWKLLEFEIEDIKQNKKQWRADSQGILIYTPSGYMSVSINSKIDGDQGSSINKFNSILFYAGTYKLNENGKIIHHVTNASDPNRIGKKMIREGTLIGDSLKLVGDGDFGIATIIWQRIKKMCAKNSSTHV